MEVDTEVVKLLDEITPTDVTVEFNKTVPAGISLKPAGISLKQHYEGFVETLERGSQIIYDRTQKHSANYVVCASNVKTVLALTTGWKGANTSKINGPYFAG